MMACCLTAPSHYLYGTDINLSSVRCIHIHLRATYPCHQSVKLGWKCCLKFHSNFPGANESKLCDQCVRFVLIKTQSRLDVCHKRVNIVWENLQHIKKWTCVPVNHPLAQGVQKFFSAAVHDLGIKIGRTLLYEKGVACNIMWQSIND